MVFYVIWPTQIFTYILPSLAHRKSKGLLSAVGLRSKQRPMSEDLIFENANVEKGNDAGGLLFKFEF